MSKWVSQAECAQVEHIGAGGGGLALYHGVQEEESEEQQHLMRTRTSHR